MKRLICIAAIASAMALQLAPAPAHASTVDDCQALITQLSAATSTAPFTTDKQGLKVQSQLLAHDAKASKALSLGEYRTATQEMQTYLSDLSNGVASGRITADAAAPLQAGAQAVIDCIGSIQ